MRLTQVEYAELTQNPKVPAELLQRVQKEVIPENWSFVGTDFSGQ